jgi:hypothetical protein
VTISVLEACKVRLVGFSAAVAEPGGAITGTDMRDVKQRDFELIK